MTEPDSTEVREKKVPARADLKTALIFSGTFGFLVAAAIPSLIPSLPTSWEPPTSIPLFSLLVGAQASVVYGLLGWAGMRMARSRGIEPSPRLTEKFTGDTTIRRKGPSPAYRGFLWGVGCGLFVAVSVTAIRHFAPGTLPKTLHPPSMTAALMASGAASFGEEILGRLFLLSFLVKILPDGRAGRAAANLANGLAFGALHAPAWIFLFGGVQNVPPLGWVWVIGFNAILGMVYGTLFLRRGLGAAIAAHFGTDLVWHVLMQAIGG